MEILFGSQIEYYKSQIVYNVSYSLSHCSSSSDITQINYGQPYTTIITADNNYTLEGATVNVMMGNVDITSTTYNNGVISIPSVTDTVIIEIIAISILSQLIAYATAQPGITYTAVTDLTNYTDTKIEEISKAISNCQDITSSTQTVYLSDQTSISVGATRSYTLSTQEAMTDRILGFNHDDLTNSDAYGEATVTGKAGMTWQMVDCLATRYPMNDTNTNAGGWNASLMRTSTLPTIKSTMPQGLQSVIKLVDKKSANGGSTNYSATVTSSDDLFLLAEIEIFGFVSVAQDGANEGTQYEYWVGKSPNDRTKYYDNVGTLIATIWWGRSSGSYATKSFCTASDTGTPSGSDASSSRGVSFAYCT